MFLAGTNIANGAIVASLSGSPLANNSTGQQLSLFLESTTGAISTVEGFNLTAFIGDGTSGQTGLPVFSSFTFDSSLTLPAVAGGSLDIPVVALTQTPVAGEPFQSFEGVLDVVTGANSFTIGSTPTLIGVYEIDTTGVFDTTVAFSLVQAGGSDTGYTDGVTQTPFTFSGTFDVGSPVAVPEPSSMALIGLGLAGVALRNRRKRALSSANAA